MEPKIVIGVTTLQYSKWMVDSLLDLTNTGQWAGWVIPECSLLPQSRNACIREAYIKVPDFTHLLFIDDDMCDFNVNHVAKMLHDDLDIVSALCTNRGKPFKIVSFLKDDISDKQVLEAIQTGEVKECNACGMAFTLIKREVFDKLKEGPDDKPIWFTLDRDPRETWPEEWKEFETRSLNGDVFDRATVKRLIYNAQEMGRTAHIGSEALGEDVVFCRKARRLGFKCWTDCGVSVGHIGSNVYDFRYAFMAAAAAVPEETKPLKLVGVEDDDTV